MDENRANEPQPAESVPAAPTPGPVPAVPMPEAAPQPAPGKLLKGFLPVMLAEVALSGVMLLVYALIGHWSQKVLLGALLGTAAELLNFTVMTLSLLRAERAETPVKGQLAARGNYILRLVVLLAVLAAALASGYFDPLATLLPLCFMRIALFAANLKLPKKEVKS